MSLLQSLAILIVITIIPNITCDYYTVTCYNIILNRFMIPLFMFSQKTTQTMFRSIQTNTVTLLSIPLRGQTFTLWTL